MNEKDNMDTKKTKIIKTVFETSTNQAPNPGSVRKIGPQVPNQTIGYAKVPQSELSQPQLPKPRAIQPFEPAKPTPAKPSPTRTAELASSQQTSAALLKRQPSDAETRHKKVRRQSKGPVVGEASTITKGKVYLTLQQRLQNYQQRHVEKVLKNEAHLGPSRAVKNVGASPTRHSKRAETGFGALGRTDKKGWLINPNGRFKKLWETFKFLLLIYTIVYLPMKISLIDDPGAYDNLTMTYCFDKFIDLIFLIDMALTFFTPAIDKNDMATEHKRIAAIYLEGWFVLDLVALIPFEEIVQLTVSEEKQESLTQLAQILKIVRLLRLLKLARLFKSFDFKNTDNYIIMWINASLGGTVLGLMLPYLALILVTAHVYACIWYFLGDTINFEESQSWLRINKQIILSSVADQYTDSLYFIAQTFTSVGYGDILSKMNNEIVYRIFAMITGVLIYSLFTGQITNSRQSALQISEEIENKTNALMRVHSKYSLNEQTLLRVMESMRLPKPEPWKKLEFRNLLEQEIDTFEYSKFLQKFGHLKLFSDNSKNIDLVLKLGRTLQSKKFEKDQIIYFKGEPAAIFAILFSGHIVFEAPFSEELPIGEVHKGYFGEYEIIRNINRQFSARAAVDTEIFYLNADDFSKIFKGPDQKELFSSMERFSEARFTRFYQSYKFIEQRFSQKLFWKTALAPFKTSASAQRKSWAINQLTHRDTIRSSRSCWSRLFSSS